jgi:lipopolysaccharide export system permease protein
MKKLLFQKFIKDNLKLFSVILLSIGSIVWIIQSVGFLEFVTEDGHGLKIYMAYTLLNFPKIIHRILPFIFFISLFYQLIQYEKRNELLIYWVYGIKKIEIINNIIIYSFLLCLLQVLLGSYLSPKSQDQARSFIRNSNMDFFPSLIREGKFVDAIHGLTIFVEKKNNLGIYENIYLKDDSENNGINTKSQVIYAKQAKLINNDQNRYFKLYKGQLIKINGKKINFINFDSINFSLSKFNTRTTTYPKIQEVNILVLLKCLTYDFKNKIKKFFHPKLGCTPSSVKNIKQEFLKRIYMPLYIPLIALITCLLILKSKENKDYQFFKLFLFFLVFFIIIVSEISLRYSTVNIYGMFFYLIFPVLLFFAIYIYLTIYFKSKI